jgi:hypothetical protein
MVTMQVNGVEKVVIFGGTGSGTGNAADLHVYDSVTNAWSQPQMSGDYQSGVMPDTQANNGAQLCTSHASLRGALYVLDEAGGFSKLDASTWSWTTLDTSAGVTGSPPGTLRSAGMAGIDSLNIVAVFGGKILGSSNAVQTLSVFNASSKVWTLMNADAGVTGSPPSARQVSALTAKGNRIFIFGGRNGHGNIDADTQLHMFDFDSKHWAVMDDGTATSPRARADFGMVAVGEKLMMYGGSVRVTPWDNAPTAEFWEFDLEGKRWIMLPLGPTARTKHKMVEYNGKLMIFGGQSIRLSVCI